MTHPGLESFSLAPHARRRGGSSTIQSRAFCDHITIDHVVTRDLRDHGLENEKVAFVVKDVFSKFRYVYPSPTNEADQCHEDLQHLLQAGDKVGVVYSDKAPELKDAVKRMKFRHNTSRAYVDENNAVIEREIRTVLEGTRANFDTGRPSRFALALRCTTPRNGSEHDQKTRCGKNPLGRPFRYSIRRSYGSIWC